jgi:hypothetical protein
MEAKERKPKRKRFTLHRVETIEDRGYAISATVLASAETKAQADAIAKKLGHRWYYGVAVWDHSTGIIDSRVAKDLDVPYSPVQPVFAVRILPAETGGDSTSRRKDL